MHSQLLEGLKCESQTENSGRVRSRGTLPGLQHFGGVEGCVGALGWDQEELTSFIYSHRPARNQRKVVSAQLEHLWCQDEPRATQTHKTHHGLDLGKPPPSPLQYTMHLSTWPTSKWLFVSRLPSGSSEIAKVGTLATLGRHNFACRPSMKMRSEVKLQLSSRAFQRYVARHLNASKSGRFPTFSGRESNNQFDSWPFFWP